MNFVETPTEDLCAVSEAIAFIDSFDPGQDLDVPNRNRSHEAHHDPPSASSDSEDKTSSVTGSKRKRSADKLGYSTRVQQGRKAEIEALRCRIAELEVYAVSLKKWRASFRDGRCMNMVSEAAQSVWQKAAAIEYQERQRSEEINRKLKSIISHQQKLDVTLRRILGRKILAQENEFTTPTEANDPRPDTKYCTATITELDHEVAKLYHNLASQILSVPSTTVSASMKTKRDDVHGHSIEMLSTTPLPCAIESAASLVWKELTTNSASARCLKGRLSHSYVKNWVVVLEGVTARKQVQGFQFLRKFEERDRVVIIKSGIMTLPSDELQFRDQCYMVITGSGTSPNTSVVQGWGQIYMDPKNTTCSSHATVLKSLGLKLREESQLLQNRLIDEADDLNL
ncbi:hypothetical protein F442_13349 [Phytophthora nicotianae P10297]|uniref:Uncharacterized protein n=2 Tax=Phytophthora nicotianae TaxID=4792 RepID=W2R506_PHYN3|nr:hypothetical protein PPTG_03462 [Phytophthora nicotianae INRA-310]ETN20463.1 hypothetical protein PPTG_03462 [Phytophthora nicotianae INRA-310]ETP39171.1 hypothetical protein F442_13349 [Phytophthora nicotianae P10297]